MPYMLAEAKKIKVTMEADLVETVDKEEVIESCMVEDL